MKLPILLLTGATAAGASMLNAGTLSSINTETLASTLPTDPIQWLALFFAFTTFYSEILAAIPSARSNAIYQQIGSVLKVVANLLKNRL